MNRNLCTDDEICKNIDQEISTPNNIIYECPNATCNNGRCNCTDGCVRDSWSGICVREYVISPTEVPTQVGVCKKTSVSPTEQVCWKITSDGYIEDCNPEDCNIDVSNMVKTFKTINGARRAVYSAPGDETEEESTKKMPVIFIIAIVFGSIIGVAAIFALFLKSKK